MSCLKERCCAWNKPKQRCDSMSKECLWSDEDRKLEVGKK